jgi:hypothetical protein
MGSSAFQTLISTAVPLPESFRSAFAPSAAGPHVRFQLSPAIGRMYRRTPHRLSAEGGVGAG